MIAISQAVNAALLHFVWQGTVVAFLLWIALLLLRNRAPNTRYAASCTALALMAALPAVTIWILYERPVSLSASIALIIPPAAHAISASPGEWLAFARQWILPLWAFGVALFAIRLGLAWRHVMRLRRAAEAAEGAVWEAASTLARRMGVAKPVRVLVSKLADAPSVVGWLRPAILMPAAALVGLDAAQLQAILAHELAHILRHDYLVNMLQTVVETLLFYHPAVWWVSLRMRHERELCCDDLAVRHCGDAIGYARALTKLERMRVMPEPAVAATGGSLMYRIQRLTGVVRECAPSRLPVVLAVLAVVLCVPLTVHRARAQQQAARTMNVQGDSIPVDYPEAAVRQGIIGAVLVEATLNGNGRAVDARVVTGPLEFRKAALRGVLDGRFVNPTAGEVRQVTIDFGPEKLAAERARMEQRPVTRTEGQSIITDGPPRQDAGAEEAIRGQIARSEAMNDALEQARQELAVTANQPEVEAQLKAEIAEQERKLAAVQRDLIMRENGAEETRVQQAVLTESFLKDKLEQAHKELAEATNQPEIEAQLKAQIAEQERQLGAAQRAMFLENQNSAWQRLARQVEESNFSAGAAGRDAEHDQRKAASMNSLLDALQRQLASAQLMYTDNHPDVRSLNASIAELRQAIVRFVAGRKLVRIDGEQLPSGFHLPVQIGDTLSEGSMNAVVSAVSALDANLEVAFFPVNEKEAAIRIVRR